MNQLFRTGVRAAWLLQCKRWANRR